MDWTLIWQVVLSGISIVFIVLVGLTLLVSLLGKVVGGMASRKKQDKADKPAPAAAPTAPTSAPVHTAQTGVPREVVAAISGALTAMLGKGFKIRSIKPKRAGGNAWSKAGVVDNTRPF